MSAEKKINFGAGPAKIPEAVSKIIVFIFLKVKHKIQRELFNYNGTGISILGIV